MKKKYLINFVIQLIFIIRKKEIFLNENVFVQTKLKYKSYINHLRSNFIFLFICESRTLYIKLNSYLPIKSLNNYENIDFTFMYGFNVNGYRQFSNVHATHYNRTIIIYYIFISTSTIAYKKNIHF